MTNYITPQKIFAHLDRVQAWRAGEKPAPVTVEWDLSNRCSRGCHGCHFAYTHTRGPLAGAEKPDGATSGGDLADAALVMRALGEAAALGVQGIVWTGGGEPTLHPDFDAIVQAAARLGLAQGMYTHGGHIKTERAALIKRVFTWVVVSLDRADEESYTAYKGRGFYHSLTGIKALVAAEGACTVGVSFLLDAASWRDAPQMAALGAQLRADYTTFRPMVYYTMSDPAMPPEDRSWITEAEPSLRAIAELPGVVLDVARFLEYRDWSRTRPYAACLGIRYNTTITPDGRVWVCPNRREFAGSAIGDLRKESFAAIWARHPGQWTDFRHCRAMCRLHLMNKELAALDAPHDHPQFV
jgi:MoaA/NifB/PqqE/SkfB family radical SAM enzyme